MAFEPGFVAALVEFDIVELGDVGLEVVADEVAGAGVLFSLDEDDGTLDM